MADVVSTTPGVFFLHFLVPILESGSVDGVVNCVPCVLQPTVVVEHLTYIHCRIHALTSLNAAHGPRPLKKKGVGCLKKKFI